MRLLWSPGVSLLFLFHNHKFQTLKKQLAVGDRELVQLSKIRWACQTECVNATLQNLPALIQTLRSISAPLAKGMERKLSRFSTIYMLVMFQTLLSITQGLHRYLQREILDLALDLKIKQQFRVHSKVTGTMRKHLKCMRRSRPSVKILIFMLLGHRGSEKTWSM